jgi:hypothetical protein
MTSNAIMDPIKSLSQPRSNPFVKLVSAASQPLRKLFKSNSERSVESTATETTQLEKCVWFSNKKHIRKTLSLKDYTLEEIKASWWSREECRKISRRCQKEVKKIDDGAVKLKGKKYCTRGLEGHTRIGSVSKVQNRTWAINAVLDEQLMQWEEGVFDEDTIAKVYRRASWSCQLWASLVGRRDHRAAEEIRESSYYKKSSAPRQYPHHHDQTTKCSNDGLEQSLVVSRAA